MIFDVDFEGSTYEWACVATSLNPNPGEALYSTPWVTGKSTSEIIPDVIGDNTLFVSIITSLFILIAIFYY